MIQAYGLKKCSTCIKACAWFDQHHLPYRFVDYRDHPLDPLRLTEAAHQLGGWEKLVNRASMTWRQLSDQDKTCSQPEQWLDLIHRYPALVRRPLVYWPNGQLTVGFRDKAFESMRPT